MTRFSWMLLVIAVLGLAGNYVLFLLALSLPVRRVAQTLAQLSSIFLLLGGVVVFGEELSPLQRIGLVILLIGLACYLTSGFLNSAFQHVWHGVLLWLCLAIVWSAYGLAPKAITPGARFKQILLLQFFGSASCCYHLHRRHYSENEFAAIRALLFVAQTRLSLMVRSLKR